MDGKRLLHSLSLKEFLSYGRDGITLDLLPLNVLIGPNASGKSNFLQSVELLRSTVTNLSAFMYEGGGVQEYLYKGVGSSATAQVASNIYRAESQIRHLLAFTVSSQRLQLVNETVVPLEVKTPNEPHFFYEFQGGQPIVPARVHMARIGTNEVIDDWHKQRLSEIRSDQSILSQRNDPDSYPALAYLMRQYGAVKVYRDFNLTGPNSLRVAQRPDLPNDFLEEDGRNLSLILNDLQHRGVMPTIVEKMRAVYDAVEDITVKIGGGTVQTFIRERGMSSPIPAARLSDGTLRYLCLLAILYHPEPPPLVCFEEPEIGMHPDLIATVADMLLDASQRMQLIVTTHSDILVSALSRVPEAIIVCERTDDGTQLRRLDAASLEKWLQDYSLGELWRSGEIGGVRY